MDDTFDEEDILALMEQLHVGEMPSISISSSSLLKSEDDLRIDEELPENLDKSLKGFELHNKPVLKKILKRLHSGRYTNIVILSGAGVSTSAGIPDFRSPKTGLYDNLEGYDIPYPEAIFDIEFYKKNQKPFNRLAKELLPSKYSPTKVHRFIKILDDKQFLLRNYTQNIDDLELKAGISDLKLIQAHGSFKTARCIDCSKEVDKEEVVNNLKDEKSTFCSCGGLAKPGIVFFGENLPERYHKFSRIDFKQVDLLIVMGTSLNVHPVAGLVNLAPKIPRLLLNREMCANFRMSQIDCAILGDLDEIVSKLADCLKWTIPEN